MKYHISHTKEGWVVSTSLPDGIGGSLDAAVVSPKLRYVPRNLLLMIKLRGTYGTLQEAGLTPFQAVGVITNSIGKQTKYRAYDPTIDILED